MAKELQPGDESHKIKVSLEPAPNIALPRVVDSFAGLIQESAYLIGADLIIDGGIKTLN